MTGKQPARALQNRLQISINGLHCDLANMQLLQTISVNDTHEPWPHLKALDFGLAVKAAWRSCRVLESPHFYRTWEGWVFFFVFFLLRVLPSHIHFNTYSVLFIKDITPSQILASCKTFHGGVFSWLPVPAVWVTHACCCGSFECEIIQYDEVSQSKVWSLQETELPLSLHCSVSLLGFVFYVL